MNTLHDLKKVGGYAFDLKFAGLDEAIEKTERLNSLLKESRGLIDEIAASGMHLEIKDLFQSEDLNLNE